MGNLSTTQDGPYCVEALKTPNTACLWVSLDYWNLYIHKDELVAIRCYKGKWGLIGFILGLFLALIGAFIAGAVGILLDKSQGETRCGLMRDRLEEALSKARYYNTLKAPIGTVKIDASTICLGSLWLKYRITLGKKDFHFEKSKYEEVSRLLNTKA